MYVFRSRASSLTRGEAGLSVKELYFRAVVSTEVYPRYHGVQMSMGSVHSCLAWSSLFNFEANGKENTSDSFSAVTCAFVAARTR
jgi:hypothetical protein